MNKKIRNLIAIFLFLATCGCSNYAWHVPIKWSLSPQLSSIDESAPHGKLILTRNSENLFIRIDDQVAFRADPSSMKSTFRLTPGVHDMSVVYSATGTGSGEIKSQFSINEKMETYISVWKRGAKISVSHPIIAKDYKDYIEAIQK